MCDCVTKCKVEHTDKKQRKPNKESFHEICQGTG